VLTRDLRDHVRAEPHGVHADVVIHPRQPRRPVAVVAVGVHVDWNLFARLVAGRRTVVVDARRADAQPTLNFGEGAVARVAS
tara:strand:- start:27 stop:272 length:246 start_codon:yes stop_codon:yes gene_type:complete